MNVTKNEVSNLTEEFFAEIRSVRQHIHAHPELSFEEFETSAYIKQKLNEFGIPFKDGYVKTGIIGRIEGNNPSKRIIALRADIDALPILEQNELAFKSENEGIMHACGHDAHTASLIGTAKILNALRNKFEGTVLLIFQPAEEKLPGGAKLMMEEGALVDPKPELIIGQHVLPGLEAGKLGFKPGMYMASTDELYLTVRGKGGHAALPHQITDNVLIAAHIIVALQQIVSRNAQASVPTVLSIGKVEARGATNIIPPEVKMEGTLRTMDENWRKEAHIKITSIAQSIAKGMGAECEVDIRIGYPYLVNDEGVTTKAIKFAQEYLGEEQIVELDLRMTAEDFAYYTQKFPSTFYRLGTTDTGGELKHPLHSPNFNIDENALKTGMGAMAWLALGFLSED